MTTGGSERPHGEWPLPDDDCDLLALWAAAGSRPPTQVVKAGSQVLGLAGPDGRPLWNCAAPASR